MNKGHLVACASCARHLRVTEPACPFCGADLPDALRSRPAPAVATSTRLSRAAIFAMSTSAATLCAAACSSSETQTLYGGPPLMVDAAYGGPPLDSGTDSPPLLLDAAYGGPPIDAADAADADDAADAGDD